MHVEYNGKLFRYILSLMDVLSRFHWLVPLETKRCRCVKEELARIYFFHGIPDFFRVAMVASSKRLRKVLCQEQGRNVEVLPL